MADDIFDVDMHLHILFGKTCNSMNKADNNFQSWEVQINKETSSLPVDIRHYCNRDQTGP